MCLALLLAAIALAAAGHAPASVQRWEPPAGARFQYQLESSAGSHAASGGIDVGICRAPVSGGSCVRPGASERTRNRALARIAHENGLSVGLKNDLGQVPKLESRFDFAVNEQCFQYAECTNNPSPGYKAFTRDGKAVFQVEYRIPPSRFCAKATRLGFSSDQEGA